MSHQSSRQGPGPSRKFVPDLKPLESRFLLSSTAQTGLQDPIGPEPEGDRGVATQSGSVLSVVVDHSKTNTVQVTDDHAGNVQAEWNGDPTHSFTGVTATSILAERATHNQITITVTSPRTSPGAVAVGSHDPTGPEPEGPRGTAVQSGPVLTVMVNRPKSNVVQLTNAGGGNVQVEWNGGMSHSFTGVATIVVDTLRATKDQVTLTD
jgi:hypothetical protein